MIVFYLISFPLCSLLLHTPCRLSEVLSGKKTWLGRAEGHAFGMQDWSSLSRGDMVLRNSVGARTGTEKGHSGATCVKDGLFFQCMLQTWYRNSMPDPPGLCCMWNQIRWSFLALKFSYSKITFPFFPSMEGAFLHKAQPHLFLSSKDPFFFFLRKFRGHFSALRFTSFCYLLFELWEKKMSVFKAALTDCSTSYSGHLVIMAPSFFWASVSIYKAETFCLCLLLPPPFWTWWFDSSNLNNDNGEITQMIFETGIGIIGYSSHQSSAEAVQMPGNLF